MCGLDSRGPVGTSIKITTTGLSQSVSSMWTLRIVSTMTVIQRRSTLSSRRLSLVSRNSLCIIKTVSWEISRITFQSLNSVRRTSKRIATTCSTSPLPLTIRNAKINILHSNYLHPRGNSSALCSLKSRLLSRESSSFA